MLTKWSVLIFLGFLFCLDSNQQAYGLAYSSSSVSFTNSFTFTTDTGLAGGNIINRPGGEPFLRSMISDGMSTWQTAMIEGMPSSSHISGDRVNASSGMYEGSSYSDKMNTAARTDSYSGIHELTVSVTGSGWLHYTIEFTFDSLLHADSYGYASAGYRFRLDSHTDQMENRNSYSYDHTYVLNHAGTSHELSTVSFTYDIYFDGALRDDGSRDIQEFDLTINNLRTDTYASTTPIPEPGTFILISLGFAGGVILKRNTKT